MLISHTICMYLFYHLIKINILISEYIFSTEYRIYFEYSSRLIIQHFFFSISGHRPLISSLMKKKGKKTPLFKNKSTFNDSLK